MKKFALLLGLLLCAVTSVSALTADELIGKWESSAIKQDPTPEMPMSAAQKYVIDFQADQKLTLKDDTSMSFEVAPGVSVDMFIKSESAGTYTVDADSVVIALDPETIKISFTEDDLRIRGLEDAAEAEMAHQQLYANFKQSFEMMKEQYAEPMALKEVTIAGVKMVCKMEDKFVTFKRKKK